MARQVHLNHAIDINAPAEVVFARVSEHENTPSFIDSVKQVSLEREGTPRNGLGAIRHVRFRPLLWPGVKEEIVLWDAPRSYHYKILSGFPGLAHHLGQWRIDTTAAGCRATWDIVIDYREGHPAAWLAGGFEKSFTAVMKQALSKIKALAES
jgi:hypothetical protein